MRLIITAFLFSPIAGHAEVLKMWVNLSVRTCDVESDGHLTRCQNNINPTNLIAIDLKAGEEGESGYWIGYVTTESILFRERIDVVKRSDGYDLLSELLHVLPGAEGGRPSRSSVHVDDFRHLSNFMHQPEYFIVNQRAYAPTAYISSEEQLLRAPRVQAR